MFALVLAALLSVSPEQIIGNSSGDAAIAASRSGFIVAWPEGVANGTQIRIARFDVYGRQTATTLLPLVTKYEPRVYALRPALASNGDDYYVAWEEQLDFFDARSNVFGMRVSAAGALDTATLHDFGRWPQSPNRAPIRPPLLGWDGNAYELYANARVFSIARDRVALLGSTAVYDAATAAPAGLSIGSLMYAQPAKQTCHTSGFSFPYCTWTAGWYEQRWSLRDASGYVVAEKQTRAGDYIFRFPAVAAGGSNDVLLAWKSLVGVDGVRIDRRGVEQPISIGTPLPLTGAAGPAAAWDGTRYLVVFDTHNGAQLDVAGAAVGSESIVNAQPLAASDANESQPHVAAFANGRFALIYLRDTQLALRLVTFDDAAPIRRRVVR